MASRAELLARLGLDIASAGSGIGALMARGLSGTSSSVSADGKPAESYPNPLHTVEVMWFPDGEPQENSMLKRTLADKAAKMQTLQQHNDTILKYLRKLPPNASEKQKHLELMKGLAEEAELDEYWDDKKPRKDFTPSSSAVKAVRVTPDNRVEVMWGSTPKWYTYKQHADPYQASLAMKELLTAPSIGRALVRKSKKYGQWGRAQYDGAMAV